MEEKEKVKHDGSADRQFSDGGREAAVLMHYAGVNAMLCCLVCDRNIMVAQDA